MTEGSDPSNTPEIKAGEGGVRRKRAKVICILSKRTERLRNRPRSPSTSEARGQPGLPGPDWPLRPERIDVDSKTGIRSVGSGARGPEFESWVVCNLGQAMNFSVLNFLTYKRRITMVTTSEDTGGLTCGTARKEL